jgi:hypothetical protein
MQNRKLLKHHRAEQQALFLELEDELRPFLTNKQMEQLEELKLRWQERFARPGGGMRGRGRGPGGGPPPF